MFIDPVSGECKFGKKVKGDMAPFLKRIVPEMECKNIPEAFVKKPKIASDEATKTNSEEL